jgi:putative protease
VHARFGKKRGVFIGQVRRIRDGTVAISRDGAVKPGDGVVFDSGHPEQPEEGGRVYHATVRENEILLRFGHDDIDFARLRIGDRVWKTDDPELNRRVRQTFAGDKPRFQRPLHFEAHGASGKSLTLIARDDSGHIARVDSAMPLQEAQNRPLTTEILVEQLGRLGGTGFKVGSVENLVPATLLLPVSELNRMRRTIVAEIEEQLRAPKRWILNQPASIPSAVQERATPADQAELVVLVRNLAQLERVLKCGIKTIYAEFEDPKKYREAVSMVHCSGCSEPRSSIWIAPPRIFKPGEEWILKQVLSANADGYLVRNYDHLEFFADHRRIGDFSLNVANALSAAYFIEKYRIERVTASYDLNAEQLAALLRSAPPGWFEITIHQHMPMFHMEHCVFCAFLSKGTDYRDCGRPCDKHEVQLRDRVGAEHPLKADAGCRNTVFNSLAQTGAEYFERFTALGARRFRVEFLNETPDQVERTLLQYRRLVRGEIVGAELWRELKLVNQLGVTRGQLAGRRSGFSET